MRQARRKESTPELSSRNLDPNLFRQPLANFFWQAIVDALGPMFRGIQHGHGRRSSHGHSKPY